MTAPGATSSYVAPSVSGSSGTSSTTVSPSLHSWVAATASVDRGTQAQPRFDRGAVHRLVERDDERAVGLDELVLFAGSKLTTAGWIVSKLHSKSDASTPSARRGEPGGDAHAVRGGRAQVVGDEAVERGVEPLALPGERRVELEHRRRVALLQHGQRRHGAAELHQDLRLDRHLGVPVAGDDVRHLEAATDGEGVREVAPEAGRRAVHAQLVALAALPAGEGRLEQQRPLVGPHEGALDRAGRRRRGSRHPSTRARPGTRSSPWRGAGRRRRSARTRRARGEGERGAGEPPPDGGVGGEEAARRQPSLAPRAVVLALLQRELHAAAVEQLRGDAHDERRRRRAVARRQLNGERGAGEPAPHLGVGGEEAPRGQPSGRPRAVVLALLERELGAAVGEASCGDAHLEGGDLGVPACAHLRERDAVARGQRPARDPRRRRR